jgi:hypothetical protein
MRTLMFTSLAFFAASGLTAAAPTAVPWPGAVATCAAANASDSFYCPQGDTAIVRMFDAAKRGDVAGVKAAAPVATDKYSKSRMQLARAFALALADPATYTEAYVDLFGRGGYADYNYLDNLAVVGLAPNVAFTIVEQRARAGDGVAVADVLGAVAPINEFHTPFDQVTIGANSALVFAAMKARGPEPVAYYLCTTNDEGRDPGFSDRALHTLRADAKTPLGRSLVAKLAALTKNCLQYDAGN